LRNRAYKPGSIAYKFREKFSRDKYRGDRDGWMTRFLHSRCQRGPSFANGGEPALAKARETVLRRYGSCSTRSGDIALSKVSISAMAIKSTTETRVKMYNVYYTLTVTALP
jgi:hypothetical protein